MSEARKGRANRAEARKLTIAERVEELLASERVNPEMKRKLSHAQARSREDSFMAGVRDQLLREAMRDRRS